MTNQHIHDPEINTRFIWLISLTAACGGLLFGYDWVVIGGAKPFYEVYFNVDSSTLSGWLMSSALVGCIVGAMVAGVLSDKFGRKCALKISALLFVISAAGTAFSDNITLFVFFRILGGIGIGLASTVSPMYISEISPAKQRGKLIALNQLTIVIGVLGAQIINLTIAEPIIGDIAPDTWNVLMGWRFMFAAELVPAVLFFILMFMVPESPRWLVKMGQKDAAQKVLSKIGSDNYASNNLQEIEASFRQENRKFSLSDLTSVKPLLIIGVVLASFQQWCGINIIFNYAQEIFASAGFDVNDTLKSIVATGVINLAFTILALTMVDKIGRRTLMIIGSGGLGVLYLIISGMYFVGIDGLPLLVMILFGIAIYASTLAPVTWILLAEIFPNRVRSSAMSACTLALWLASFGLTFTFPFLIEAFAASGSFLFYALICFLSFRFIYLYVPETKKLTLEQIEKNLAGDKLVRQNS
jgi:SP family xylose:H+ symportor-like MFS transporter